MNQPVVLKAGMAATVPQSRVLLRAAASPVEAVLSEPGVWFRQSDLDALREGCVEQGFQRGMEQGRQQALTDARREAEHEARQRLERELKALHDRHDKEQLEKWRGLTAALASQVQELRDRLEADVTEWTFIATARLLGCKPPEDVVAAVRQVLAEANLDGPLTVLLHADDLATVEAGRVAHAGAWPANLRFVADARVKLGGCLVQSAVQTLDARLEVQLALLRDQLDLARLQRTEGAGES